MAMSSKAQEPSMDEILDSIRRIIADEDLAFDLPSEGFDVCPGLDVQQERRDASSHHEPRLPPVGPYRGRGHVLSMEPPPARYAVSGAQARRAPVEQAASAPVSAHMHVVGQPLIPQQDRVPGVKTEPREAHSKVRPAPSVTQVSMTQGRDRMNTTPPSSNSAANLSSQPHVRPAAGPSVGGRQPLPRKDLLSPAVDAAVSAAFQSLGDLVLPQKDRTVEDLVKEILRPMLKEWLDQNLAGIVERLVRAEIERVTRDLR
ncbi:MAG: DUF2497 domain-containing protein [Xanthobacter sp.]